LKGILNGVGVEVVHQTLQQADGGGYRSRHEVFADLLEALPWRVQMSIEDLTMHWQTVTLYRAGSRCSWRPHLEPPGT
jgi:hypothetical protein